MAKKKHKPAQPAANAKTAPGAPKQTAPQQRKNGFVHKYAQTLIVCGIALVTFLFYVTILDNKLTNWDDLGYITSNTLIRDSSWEGIKAIFSTANPVMGNYHPLTILLYDIEYHYRQLDPFIYHFDSLVLHVLTTIAVYFFVRRLTGNMVTAVVAALLFGLHPMHVESVASGAGRKDGLYGLFFVLSCTAYLNYTRGNKAMMWYTTSIVLFGLSLLSKSVAVTLPVTLFLIDYYEGRKWSWKLLADKAAYFLFALLFGLLSIQAQKQAGALGSLDVSFTIPEHIALGAYALCTYLWKAVLPLGMCNFYPYPLKENGALPGMYYIYPVLLAALIFVVWRYGRKNKTVVFGLGFFLVNIFLLLQFIEVGGAIISDRYGYIPYLGLFIMAGSLVAYYYDKGGATGKLAMGGALCYCLVLGFATNVRCKDWHDSLSLWNDDREKHPDAPVAYFYLGQAYSTLYDDAKDNKEKQTYLDSCLYYYQTAIAHKPDYVNALICLGEVERNIGAAAQAKINYDAALRYDGQNAVAYMGSGIADAILKQYDSADYCFKKAIALKPVYPEAHSNYANFLDIAGKVDSALAEYAIAIEQNPEAVIPYLNRARIYTRQGRLDSAISDYNKALQLDPKRADAYYSRSRIYALKGNKQQALQDVEKARALGYPSIDPAYYAGLKN